MTLVVNPIRNLIDARTNIDRIFDEFFRTGEGWNEMDKSIVPAVNIEENDENFLITAELPGLSRDDVHIMLENNRLTISGEKKVEEKHDEKNYHRLERRNGKFIRRFDLPGAVDQKKIDAGFNNGILEITIPKAEEAKPRQIEIKVR